MTNQTKKWEILNKEKVDSREKIVDVILKNRGITSEKDRKEFLNPIDPIKISPKSLGIKDLDVKKAIDRIKDAKKNQEEVIVYGDYDADGICATAILWEALHNGGLDVLPHIPDRFSEGYGINAESVQNLKTKIPNLKLIVTVDNGIVAYNGIAKAKELEIDVIVIDHHTKGQKKNYALSIIHSTLVCGSALAWFFARELEKSIKYSGSGTVQSLELAAIGTIADQMPLVGVNRSIVKWGLAELNKTKRPGLKMLFENSKIDSVGTYEVNYIIAPRINAMGRLAQGLDSLRFLCTHRLDKAKDLSDVLNKTNLERQKIVDEVTIHARSKVTDQMVIVLSHKKYHEGVIGLAAGKLVEEYYRPAIVLSEKGEVAKGSARSISGFNIIEAIRATEMILEGGGHPMAAGFSIETSKIELFIKKINKIAKEILTPEVLLKKLKIDVEIGFKEIGIGLIEQIKNFEPSGLGNPTPTFLSRSVEVQSIRAVGNGAKHLKITLKQGEHVFDSIFFGGGENYSTLKPGSEIDVVYYLEENVWNGNKSIQLKIRDLKV